MYPAPVLNPIVRALAVAAGLAIVASSAQATTLYSHTFDGGTGNLNLVGPDEANTGTILGADHGTSTANWTVTQQGSGTEFARQNGDITDDVQAELAFNPVDGFVYTLTATGTTISGWLGLGYVDTNAGQRMFQTGVAWTLKTATTFQSRLDPDGGTGGLLTPSSSASSATESFSIQLDTRDGAGLWDVYYYAEGSTTPYTTATDIGTTAANNINRIAFAAESTTEGVVTSNIQSFSLTVAIPEPSSALLLGVAGFSLLAMRGRRD